MNSCELPLPSQVLICTLSTWLECVYLMMQPKVVGVFTINLFKITFLSNNLQPSIAVALLEMLMEDYYLTHSRKYRHSWSGNGTRRIFLETKSSLPQPH